MSSRRWRHTKRWLRAHGRDAVVVGSAVVATGVLSVLAFQQPEPPNVSSASEPQPTLGGGDPGCGRVRLAVLGDSTRDERAAAGPYMAEIRANLSDVPARNIVSFGENGAPLADYSTMGAQQRLRDFDPNMIELSIGINDLRLDQSPERVAEFRADLADYVERLHREYADAALVLSVPAALSMRDVGGAHYVAGSAQAVTTALRETYLQVAETHPFVVLNDVQRKVTGTHADTSRPPTYLADQLHPSPETQGEVADTVTTLLLNAC